MANVLVNDLYLGNIADAIREKLNVQTKYKPSEMANAIDSISGGGSTPTINSLSVTENGTYTAPTGVDGYSPVTVNVPQGVTPTGTKQISITQNGTTTEDVTNYASAEITVNVPSSSGVYDLNGDTFFELFDQYATEKQMKKIDLSFSSDVTSNYTVQHNLGYVPTEALLYPKNPIMSGNGYQMGWVKQNFGQDKSGNRTYWLNVRSPSYATYVPWYGSNASLLDLLSSVENTLYNFTQSAPTSTEITIRGGTSSQTKLLAGEYVLAVK